MAFVCCCILNLSLSFLRHGDLHERLQSKPEAAHGCWELVPSAQTLCSVAWDSEHYMPLWGCRQSLLPSSLVLTLWATSGAIPYCQHTHSYRVLPLSLDMDPFPAAEMRPFSEISGQLLVWMTGPHTTSWFL